MQNIPKELQEYVEIFYNFNNSYVIPKNVNINLLNEKDFFNKIDQKIKELFKIKQPNIENNINGLVILDTKNKYRYTYNVYILKEQEEIYPYVVSVLFHELSHIHTLPNIDSFTLKKFDENNYDSYEGYIFWKEFIANYIGEKTFLNTYGSIGYISDKKKLIEFLKSSFQNKKLIKNIDELLAFILLSKNDISNEIQEILGEKSKIFFDLINTCKTYIQLKNIKDITKEQLDRIGNLIDKLKKP